ncbi:MAG: M28 family peptidase [Candidatus Bathyarchaeia archaeon]
MLGIRASFTLFIFLLIVSSPILTVAAIKVESAETVNLAREIENSDFIFEINYTSIKEHVKMFASMFSRVTGYAGSYAALDYILAVFRKYRLKTFIQNYTLVIPYDEGSWIEANDQDLGKFNITAYALWPNGVQTCLTPPEGITGRLIYVENGELEKINGHTISGSIILMDFNSEDNWIRIANLGAKGIIFIEPSQTTFIESLQKATPAPLYLPRLYVDSQHGLLLKSLASKNSTVTIHCRMRWKEVVAQNIIGVINGSMYENEVIVISANYDSWSIVPALAPGSESALGISSLLEIARLLTNNKPKRTVWLVAFSGYYQGLIGPIEWVEHNIFAQEVLEGKTKILLHLHLDFSTDSDKIDVLYTGPPRWFGNLDEFSRMFLPIEKKISQYLSPNQKDYIRFNFASMRWGTQPPIRDNIWLFNLATQPTLSTGIYALTLRTQWAYRATWLTPLDDEKCIFWSNLNPQLKTAFAIIQGFVNDPQLNLDYTIPSRFTIRAAAGRVPMGFTILRGSVVEYNVSSGWYSPKPRALVRLNLYDPNAYLAWPFNSQWKFTDGNGSFVFHGLIPWTTYNLDAWMFDNISGRITFAVDRGIYGTATGMSGGISTELTPFSPIAGISIPIFECTEITLFDLIDTKIMKRCSIPWTTTSATLEVYDYATKSFPIFYGTYYSPSDGIGLVFVKRGSKVIITFNPRSEAEIEKRPRIVLTNSTLENPEGFGFYVDAPLTIYNTALVAARDLYLISKGRYEKLSNYRIKNLAVEVILEKANALLLEAEYYLEKKIYNMGYACALASLAFSSTVYSQGVMPLFDDISRFILLFMIPTLLFAFFFEKLILHNEGLKRIIGVAGVLILSLLAFSSINPAFSLLENVNMAMLGIGLLMLMVFILAIIINEARELMEITATTTLGKHIVKTERTAALLHSISVAVDNLRRRKLITALTLASLIIFTATMTSFTSASYILSIKETPSSSYPPYDGILLKRRWGMPPTSLRGGTLDTIIIHYLTAFVGDSYYIAPRVWFYPISIYPEGISVYIDTPRGVTKPITPLIFLGLSEEEATILFSDYIVEGPALIKLYDYGCLLSKELAASLNISYGDKISIKGTNLNLTVIGIIDVPMEKLRDFDDRLITPVNPFYSTLLSRMVIPFSEQQEPNSLSLANVMIVNWKTAYKLGGFVSSVALIPKAKTTLQQLREIGKNISLGIDVSIYVGCDNVSFSLSKHLRISVIGWEIVWVLMALIVFSTINVLIGTIQRRNREFFVYASLGLSPFSAALMFIAEATVYGAISSVIGYIGGYLLTILFPSFIFNISSIYVVISLFSVLGTCLLSAIYPSIIVARLITPSLERRWKTPTKPVGDRWELNIPLKVIHKSEASGILRYLSEYYTGLGSQKRGFIVDGVPIFDPEKLQLILQVTLLPTELGINQEVIVSMKFEENAYTLSVLIKRKSGDLKMWESLNYDFIDDLRKQVLLWKTLSPAEKTKYMVQ